MATDFTSAERRALRIGSEPAMPLLEDPGDQPSGARGYQHLGLSKRELFAMAAMQGLLARAGDCSYEGLSRVAVKHADALLEELAK